MSKLSLRSLNHDLFTIVDVEALGRLIDSDAAQGVPLTVLTLGVILDSLDACCRCLECNGNRHRIIRHDEGLQFDIVLDIYGFFIAFLFTCTVSHGIIQRYLIALIVGYGDGSQLIARSRLGRDGN